MRRDYKAVFIFRDGTTATHPDVASLDRKNGMLIGRGGWGGVKVEIPVESVEAYFLTDGHAVREGLLSKDWVDR